MNNRVTAQGYTASEQHLQQATATISACGLFGFKVRLREGLMTAQVRAIVAREGMSAMSGIVSLAIVFATMTMVAVRHSGDTALLIALATTLPRQIEMTYQLHLLATGWNDFIAIWTRFGGVADNMLPQPDPNFVRRIKFDRLVLREGDDAHVVASLGDALRIARRNRPGASTSAAATAREIFAAGEPQDRDEEAGYYWPTTDRLAFKFSGGVVPIDVEDDDEGDTVVVAESMDKKLGFSSGERQLKSLEEIVNSTDAQIYLLDEWDANLDAANKAKADALVDQLAARARVVEFRTAIARRKLGAFRLNDGMVLASLEGCIMRLFAVLQPCRTIPTSSLSPATTSA